MSTASLTLCPHNESEFEIELSEDGGNQADTEKVIEGHHILNNRSYEFVLKYDDLKNVKQVRVYINDAYESAMFNRKSGRICFPDKKYPDDRKIFIDCFGLVELSLTLIMNSGEEHNLSSKYIQVWVSKGKFEWNKPVKAMAKYVHEHKERLLFNGEPKSRDRASLREGGRKSFEVQIALAKELAAIYESSYGYFKANSRFCVEKVPVTDRFERLQYITPTTLEYISSHPEQLKPVSGSAGIRVGKRVYQPEKTLSLQNKKSYDIYENRVVLGFLRKMVDEIGELQEECKKQLRKIPVGVDRLTDTENEEYISSAYFIISAVSPMFSISETRKTLENDLNDLSQLYNKFTNLWSMYSFALDIPREPLVSKPRPTAVFLSVPQYNKIFVRIHQWFTYGIYDFAKEKYILPFINVSSLYESYLLAKMLTYFTEHKKYELIDSKPHKYTMPEGQEAWLYKNTDFHNTFTLSKNETRITLYYQPVVYKLKIDDEGFSYIAKINNENGVGLYRNMFSADSGGEEDKNQQGDYYTPDYIVKVENINENRAKYLILDAKFSDFYTVKDRHLDKTAKKYLFSISPAEEKDFVAGMCLLYGKCKEWEKLKNAYNKKFSDGRKIPSGQILPLIEGIGNEAEQYSELDKLFAKVL